MDEGDEAELVDAWWNPPPTAPLSCPPTIAPPGENTAAPNRQTISLEELEH